MYIQYKKMKDLIIGDAVLSQNSNDSVLHEMIHVWDIEKSFDDLELGHIVIITFMRNDRTKFGATYTEDDYNSKFALVV